jgi:hypothetical protein
MAQLPSCPECHQNDKQRLASETDSSWTFVCIRCPHFWVVSKPHVKAKAAMDKAAARIKQITQAERELLGRRKYFI